MGDLGTIQTCKRIFKDQTSESGEIPFYKNGTIGLKADAFISREIFEEYKLLYPYPEKGDILISAVGSVGRTAEYTGEDEYFQDSNVVWLKTDNSIDKKYLKVFYQVIKWLIEGSTVKHLYNDNILKSEIVFPYSLDEQRKIGEYFDSLDHLITLHQWKHYRIKKIINSAWEQRKVSELLYLSNEKNDGSYTRDDVLAASLGTELQKKHIYFGLRATDESVKNYKVVLPKDVIYTKSPIKGFPNGIIRTNKGETGIVPTLYCVYHSIDTINPSIIQAYFESKERLDAYLVPLVNIGARNNVNITDKEFINGSICIPKNETEQNRIVDLLEKISNLITLHQQKYKSLKKLKKFMVKNMFLQVKCKNTEKDR